MVKKFGIIIILLATLAGVWYSAQPVRAENIEEIKQKVLSFAYGQDDPAPHVELNQNKATLNPGESTSLKLVKDDGSVINGASWYVVTRFPQDAIFTVDQSAGPSAASFIKIDSNGNVTAKNSGDAYAVAVHDGNTYVTAIKVRTDSEKRAAEREAQLMTKADEIAGKTNGLSDIDKIIYVHDYLIDHMHYDSSQTWTGGLYEAIVEGKGTCRGYTWGFKYIMDRIGIQTEAVTGVVGDVKHAFNRVHLDDGWYYIDLTWDDQGNVLRHKYSLMDRETAIREHTDFVFPENEQAGSRYINYYFKKNNLKADTLGELRNVFDNKIGTANADSVEFEFLAAKSIDHNTALNLAKTAAGPGSKVQTTSLRPFESFGDYNWHKIKIYNIPRSGFQNVSFQNAQAVDNSGKTTREIIVTLDHPVADLTASADGAEVKSVTHAGGNNYKLTIDSVTVKDGEPITIKLGKSGVNITPQSRNVTISVSKAAKPQAVFEAVDDYNGVLKNLKAGMKYTVGDGVWHNVTVDGNQMIKPRYAIPITVIQSAVNGDIDSDPQQIAHHKASEPNWVTTEAADNNVANGKLIKGNTRLEYQKDGGVSWTSFNANEVTGLAPGTYHVRVKARGNTLASGPHTLVITENPAAPPIPSPIPTITLSAPSVTQNSSVTINLSNFNAHAGQQLDIWLNSDPILLGTVTIPTNGSPVSLTAAIPCSVQTGAHNITVVAHGTNSPILATAPVNIIAGACSAQTANNTQINPDNSSKSELRLSETGQPILPIAVASISVLAVAVFAIIKMRHKKQ